MEFKFSSSLFDREIPMIAQLMQYLNDVYISSHDIDDRCACMAPHTFWSLFSKVFFLGLVGENPKPHPILIAFGKL